MPDLNRRSFIEQLGVLGGTGAAVGLAGCTSNSSDSQPSDSGNSTNSGSQSVSLLIGSVYPSGHAINEMAKDWASTVAEETDDRIDITIEAGFGGEKEVMEQTRIGAIQGTLIGTRWVIDYDPKNFWVESPFVFENWEQQRRAFESEYLEDGRERLREEGNQALIGPPVYRGYRHTSGNQSFKDPSAIQNVNLRVPGLDPWVNIWDGIGASPTTVAFDELYSGLQQGVVDAQENPAETMLSASLYEVQDYYTLTKHLASTGWCTINTNTLSNMSEEDRNVVTSTLETKINNLSENIAASEEEAIQSLKDNGMNVVEADRDAWLTAAKEPLQQQFEADWEPTLEEVRNI
ncbi:TRAP transporter substrate-binding protein DctP [Halobacterium sp. KA-6]|uniref:TRAP transporter substrate-binding protein DctP n=1 Tax=Halobacterium sp. KA-6 TaxID=2896368 RepID=UPI001E457AF2|nr:TRAP transporter substrate-binding protein DctP [Halobacterium sp. KA-6]MCD2203664.1 TRAP transporter substrate-binding protein DctP [Halobacterium sp. KA-6]